MCHMAGQAQRGSSGRGRSQHPASSSRSRAAASAVASGRSPSSSRTRSKAAPAPTVDSPTTPITRTTYRLLLQRGLSTEEAVALTAFLCGIPIDQVRWSLRQINQLMFLRELARTGRFGPRDGEPPRPH
jgi:hypothetical protein